MFIAKEDFLEKIKALAYYEIKEIKRVIEEVLGNYLEGKIIRLRQ